jgi:hypothetical protein
VRDGRVRHSEIHGLRSIVRVAQEEHFPGPSLADRAAQVG